MVFAIVSVRVIDPAKDRTAYRVRGVGDNFDQLCDWLDDRRTTLRKVWCSWPHLGWEFTNSNDDVEIRIRWGECFWPPDCDRVEDDPEALLAYKPSSDEDLLSRGFIAKQWDVSEQTETCLLLALRKLRDARLKRQRGT